MFRKFNRVYIIGITLVLFSACLNRNTFAQQNDDRPNILWIVSEDNNSAMIGCYGNTFSTTPNIDKLATQGIRYQNAFSTAPVCAPSRCTLITGMYPPSLGTEHMRSNYPIPAFVKFFPRYLREAGYYTSNNLKKDYNTVDQTEAWDESSDRATYKNRRAGQPFFSVFNLLVSHESSIHVRQDSLRHNPDQVPLPPYHPATKDVREDWAQYYDKVETMDSQVGKLLRELDEAGLADNTIVFYYSDNGGVLPRSKRFMFESGLHVPLIVRFPEKYKHLSTGAAGTVNVDPITFLDFAPTVLSLSDIKIPTYMQGSAFLGKQKQAPHEYAYGFRGRMDERIDMSRAVRDKKYRYIRNYLPHLNYGEHLRYLWQAASTRSWEAEYTAGKLNAIQSAFWKPKPAEELYDVASDPDNVNNLAGNPKFDDVLKRFRKANQQYVITSRDAGFIPEAILFQRAQQTTPLYTQVQQDKDLPRIIETADLASSRDPKNITEIIKRLNDPNPSVRYWAAIGCTVLKESSTGAKAKLVALLQDIEGAVQVAAAEALFHIGAKEQGLTALTTSLKHENQFVRLQALNVLLTLGDEARPALEAVKRLIPEGPIPPPQQEGQYDIRAARSIVELLEP